VDLEDLFHSFGIRSPYENPRTWDDAPSCVVADTETLMRMLDNAGVRGTFLALVWIAERHPDLIRRLAREGHEIGCHTHYHRLVFELTPEDFESDLARSLAVLRDVSGQPVDAFRAAGFPSATLSCGRFLFYAATASRSIFQSCQHAGIMAE
jgi:peptidoglycan/xylan/chitin deacetylase (PgdA/CDA1 family)